MTAINKEAAAAVAPFAGWRRVARLTVLVVLTAGVAAAWRWRAAFDPIAIGAAIAGYPATPLVFLGVHIVASLLFVPRTVLAIAAGLLFGIGWGIVWAAIGSVLGAVVGFCLARYVNSGLIDLHARARFRPILDRVQRGGWRAVALLRLIPVIPHSLGNYGLGLDARCRSAPMRAWFPCRPIADDDRLRRSRHCRRAAGDGGCWLGRPDRDRRGGTRTDAADPGPRSPPRRIAGAQCRRLGAGLPVAQSRSSTVCKTGASQPGAKLG